MVIEHPTSPRSSVQVGDKFGFIEAIFYAGPGGARRSKTFWFCRCRCGKEWLVATHHLQQMTSCGCTKPGKQTHGKRDHPEYGVWASMKNRCHNPKVRAFRRYGARGIQVCSRWRYSFEAFVLDMGPRPSPRHSIERMDNDGNYCPENCRWATKPEQARNMSSNVMLTHNGRTMCAMDWAKETGLKYRTILCRISYGWSHDRALTTPRYGRNRQ